MTSQLDESIECVLVLHIRRYWARGTPTQARYGPSCGRGERSLERHGKVAVKYHPGKEAYLGEYQGCEVIPKQA